MDSRDRTRRLRNMLAASAWIVAPLLIIMFVLILSTRSSAPVAEAHGTVDQSQLLSFGGFICDGVGPIGGGCGQTFTPTASNIVAFDLSVSTSTTVFNAMFVLRQWPAGPVLAGPFPVTVVLGVNHIDIPGAPIAITPGTKYEIQETTANIRFDGLTAGDPYPAGGFTVGTPVRTESCCTDMYFATYFAAFPDLTITKTDSPDPVMPGNNITYTITVTDIGSAACCLELSDTIPAGTTFVSWSQTLGPAFILSGPVAGQVHATGGSLSAGQSATFVLVVNVPASTPGGTTITNTATILCTDCSEQNTANNSATAQTLVVNPTATPTVTITVTRTVTPTVTPTGTLPPTSTPTRTPTVRPQLGAFLEGSSGAQRNLERAGLIPGPANSAAGIAQAGPVSTGPVATDPASSGLLRPPNTGDAGLVNE